jgi:hypothetical protein
MHYQLTFTDNFTIDVPIAEHGKKKSQRVYDRDSQAQF